MIYEDKCELTVDKVIYPIPHVKRYVTNSESAYHHVINADGLRKEGYENRENLFSEEDLLEKLPGGLIIGEGDIGKTELVRHLKLMASAKGAVEFYRLRNWHHNYQEIDDLANKVRHEAERRRTVGVLFLDGLDECEEAFDDVLEICRDHMYRKDIHIWVTSRSCDKAALLRRRLFDKEEYHLLPLSRSEIMLMARPVEKKRGHFLRLIKEQGLVSIATKPGGVRSLLVLYARNRIEGRDRVMVMEELARDLAQESRDGAAIDQTENHFPLNDVMDMSAWIAARMYWSNCASLWTGALGACPSEAAITSAEVELEPYNKPGLLKAALSSRIFEPLRLQQYRVSYRAMGPFLMARWFAAHGKDEDVLAAFPRPQDYLPRDCAEVMSWLGVFRPQLAASYLPHRPEVFMMSAGAITAFGEENYCNALLKRFDELAFDDARDQILIPMDALKGTEAMARWAISEMGEDKTSEEHAVFYARLLQRCNGQRASVVEELAHVLVTRSFSVDRLAELIDILRDIVGSEPHPSLPQLKELLPLYEQEKLSEYSYSILLRILWPRYMNTAELAAALVPKHTEIYNSDLDRFVEYYLPRTLEKTLTKENIIPLLTWAEKRFREGALEIESYTKLARDILMHAVHWVDDEDVGKLLASAFMQYVAHSPTYEATTLRIPCELQRPVLRSILRFDRSDENHLALLWTPDYYDNAFSQTQDWTWLFGLWQEFYGNGELDAAHRAARLLHYLALHEYQLHLEDMRQLHEIYPEGDFFNVVIIERDIKEGERIRSEREAQIKGEQEGSELEHHAKFLRESLVHRDEPGFMRWFAQHVFIESTKKAVKQHLDFNKAPVWKYFSKEDKEAIYDAAANMVLHDDISKAEHSAFIARAIAANVFCVGVMRPKVFDSISGERWRELLPFVLETWWEPDETEVMELLMIRVRDHHKEEVAAAVRSTVINEVRERDGHDSALNHSYLFLEDSEYDEIVQAFSEDVPEQRKQMLRYLQGFEASPEHAPRGEHLKAYFAKLFPDMTPPDKEYEQLFVEAMECYPGVYCHKAAWMLRKHPDYMKNMLLRVLKGPDAYTPLIGALLQADNEDQLGVFDGLRRMFPGRLDDSTDLYEMEFSPEQEALSLKRDVFGVIVRSASEDLLNKARRLQKECPSDEMEDLIKMLHFRVQEQRTPMMRPLSPLERMRNPIPGWFDEIKVQLLVCYKISNSLARILHHFKIGNNHYSKMTLVKVKRMWEENKYGSFYLPYGREAKQTRKVDVFNHFAKDLAKMGIYDLEDFEKALDAARKMHA